MSPLKELLGWSGYAVFCVILLVLYYKSSRKSEVIEKNINKLAKIVSRETISRREK